MALWPELLTKRLFREDFSEAKTLSTEMVKTLVKEMRITEREQIEIRWDFKDEVLEFIRG